MVPRNGSAALTKLLRLFHTLRYLRLRQIVYQIYYRLSGQLTKNGAQAQVQWKVYEQGFLPEYTPALSKIANRLPTRLRPAATFSFLNREVDFKTIEAVNWNYAAYGKLWTYNLNYFEFLRQPNVTPDQGEALISAWIKKADTLLDAWEPYPISLRLVNWIFFFATVGRQPSISTRQSMARQYQALWQKVEYHLGGNHLLENAIALTIGARYLGDLAGKKRADQLLLVELKEQYLEDGGHFELSPMYHLILLWRCLDLFAFLPSSDQLRQNILPFLEKQLGWAREISTASGAYPHFNDSTIGVAPDLGAIVDYAELLGIDICPVQLSTSGYRHWQHAGMNFWFDVAQIGPEYIPGHAHADNLTFVLYFAGKPVVVDPGITTYEKNANRYWERSTAAHNTVSIGRKNSSDVWGGFRVGRRARTKILQDQPGSVIAEHNGYRPVVHQRVFRKEDFGFSITDAISEKEIEGTAIFNFASGISPEVIDQVVIAGPIKLCFYGAKELQLKNYDLSGGFNVREKAWRIEVLFFDELRCEIIPVED